MIDASDLIDELIDRYGDPPDGVDVLMRISLLRSLAAKAGISEIIQKQQNIRFQLSKLDFARVSELCALPRYKRRLLFNAGDKPYLSLRLNPGDSVLSEARSVVEAYSAQDKTR
jgi:transcription-repair coupling factor (superfamily II helicase)